jgi:hypothetical protein
MIEFSRLSLKKRFRILMLLMLPQLFLPVIVRAQFIYVTNNGAITITGYTGSGGTLVIPNTINGLPVTAIGSDAFFNTALTWVAIGTNVTTIGGGAFQACTSLSSIYLPNSVTSIGNDAFWDCAALPAITIPISVTNIGVTVFYNCSSLTAITVDANNPAYSSANGVLFTKSQTTLIQYPEAKTGAYQIPSGVTNIGAYAFKYCYYLTNVTIPTSVMSIGTSGFAACGLTAAYFQGNAPSGDSSVFSSDIGTVYYLAGTSGWGTNFGGLPTEMLNEPSPAGSLQVTILPAVVTTVTNGAKWQVDGGVLQPSGATVLGLSVGSLR